MPLLGTQHHQHAFGFLTGIQEKLQLSNQPLDQRNQALELAVHLV
jgi:hypothetical protein